GRERCTRAARRACGARDSRAASHAEARARRAGDRAAHRARAWRRAGAVGRRRRFDVTRRRPRDSRGRGTASGRAGIAPARVSSWGRAFMTAVPMVLMRDEEVAAYGRDPDAGFGALETARGCLPLAAMDVDARVTGVIATVELAQTFVNATASALEATYIFPLPDRAAVHRLRMEVGGRVIDGAIDERGAARAHYDQAIAAGHRAAIAEEDRAGVFTLRVGNLMPGEAATVRLSLVGPLPIDDGEVTFRFPLVVAPRYIPGTALGGDQAGLGRAADTDLVPDASRISPPVRLPGCPNPVRLGLRVALEDGVMREVASSLHAVTVARRDAQVVEVQPGERLDRDFILRWRIAGAALASSLVCADDPGGAAGAVGAAALPPATPRRPGQ